MWLIVTLIATAIAATAFFLLKERREEWRLGLLTLMLLGTAIMVLVDHAIAFLHGEPFIETTTDGLIANGTLLGLAMLLPILLVWGASVWLSRRATPAR